MKSPANEYTTGRGFLESIRDEANEVTEMLTLAVAIADQTSRFDIQYGCTFVINASGEWIDTQSPSPEVSAMNKDARQRYGNQLARALRYLELRGQVVRNPTFPYLIRFEEERLH